MTWIMDPAAAGHIGKITDFATVHCLCLHFPSSLIRVTFHKSMDGPTHLRKVREVVVQPPCKPDEVRATWDRGDATATNLMGAMSDRYQAHVDDEREPSGASGLTPVPLFGMSDQLGRIAQPAPVTPQAVTESVLDSPGVLVTSSLIQRSDDPHGEPRFSLLQTVRSTRSNGWPAMTRRMRHARPMPRSTSTTCSRRSRGSG